MSEEMSYEEFKCFSIGISIFIIAVVVVAAILTIHYVDTPITCKEQFEIYTVSPSFELIDKGDILSVECANGTTYWQHGGYVFFYNDDGQCVIKRKVCQRWWLE